ncbi:MAG: maleylpyruvate isomerase N-terminal domain-containing protein [Dehalococcoidia bacterium]
MLEEDRAEWEALTAVLDAHSDVPLHDPKSPSWASRDVYAHFARWTEHSIGQLGAHLEGRKLPKLEGTDDEINARWQQEDGRLTLDEARAWAIEAVEQRIQAIAAVPVDRWDDALEQIARADGAEHMRGHRSYLTIG